MRIIGLIAVAGIIVLATNSRASSDAAPVLTGKMSRLNYLVGAWSCTTKVPAIGKMHAMSIPAKITYWIEPENVIGNYYSSRPYSSSGFLGWIDSKKLWWANSADMAGGVNSETGKDSGTNVQVMTGTNWYQGKATALRDMMTKTSDASYSDTSQLLQSGKVTFQVTAICTKTSNKTM
jgi:hypothetical protein